MNRFFWALLMVGLMLATPVCGQEAEGKKKAKGTPDKAMVSQFMKQLEVAELSAEQKTKIEEMFSKVAKEVVTKRTDIGLTPEMLKKRTDASKAAKAEGKKQKEVKELALAAMGATEEQKKCLLDTEELVAKTKLEIGKLLSEEQLAKLGPQVQGALKPKQQGKKPKDSDKA